MGGHKKGWVFRVCSLLCFIMGGGMPPIMKQMRLQTLNTQLLFDLHCQNFLKLFCLQNFPQKFGLCVFFNPDGCISFICFPRLYWGGYYACIFYNLWLIWSHELVWIYNKTEFGTMGLIFNDGFNRYYNSIYR